MKENYDLVQRINEAQGSMSKGHKRIAQFILTNYDKAAFMTALQLGDMVGVSESTVVRFAMNLGYEGYPELQRALQDKVRNKLTTLQRMEMTSDMSCAGVLKTVLKADTNNLRYTMDEVDAQLFEQVVQKLCAAEKIYILGRRSSAPLAQFLGYYLSYMMDNIVVVTSGINDILEQLVHIRPNDALIGISFPRYSKRTMEGMRFAHDRGASIVAITDSKSSPLGLYADYLLPARSNIATFVDSPVAAFSLANALIVAISQCKRDVVSNNFSQLEGIWEEYDVYLEKSRQELLG
ncbi:MAG: MurR/RpiR family transcriptional regulator [Eubacteriales bacterium]|nr:MurR/RpiR family transcriptional regulator [Eubacteriales bacterium]